MLTFVTIAASLLLAALIAYLVLRPRIVDRRFGLRMVGDRHGYIELRDDDRVAHLERAGLRLLSSRLQPVAELAGRVRAPAPDGAVAAARRSKLASAA